MEENDIGHIVVSLKPGEVVAIGEDVEICVLPSKKHSRISLRITAPKVRKVIRRINDTPDEH